MVDREDEWALLERLWQSDKPELLTVVGRRRVGKSYLLTRFAETRRGLYYQAARRTEAEQLRAVAAAAGRHLGDPALERGAALPDWDALLSYLVAAAASDRFLVVLDEFPYLSETTPALPSILQGLWDQVLPSTKIKLVLSGSYITAMQRLTGADQPLYGRRTAQLKLRPFSYREVAGFVPGYDARDRLITYGVFGGLPGHLAIIDPRLSLRANVALHVLSPTGRLHDEGARVLDAFLGEAAVHYSIVQAVATGEHKWSKIANRVGRKSASLTRPLEWLMEMDIVERYAPLADRIEPNPKSVRYRIADPYLRFWHRMIAPIVASGMAETVAPEELWDALILPRLDAYMGSVFEEACRAFVRRSEALPFRVLQVGQWWDERSRAEIDVVAVGAAGDVLLGECKWGAVGRDDLAALEARAVTVGAALRNVRRIHLALFSAAGIADASVRRRIAAGDVLHYTLEDLFQTPGARDVRELGGT